MIKDLLCSRIQNSTCITVQDSRSNLQSTLGQGTTQMMNTSFSFNSLKSAMEFTKEFPNQSFNMDFENDYDGKFYILTSIEDFSASQRIYMLSDCYYCQSLDDFRNNFLQFPSDWKYISLINVDNFGSDSSNLILMMFNPLA